ncbi:hypothetical protein, partial [Methanocaldococcus sp.]
LRDVIVTVQSKKDNVYDLLDLYSSYNVGLCVVLGNRKYLKENERKKDNRVILDVINKALNLFDEVWVGTEKVESIVKDVIDEYELTAFYLYGDRCSFKNKAIYVPFSFELKNREFIKNYLERRKSKDLERFILTNPKYVKPLIENNNYTIFYPIDGFDSINLLRRFI